jgi:hypothetical protein
MGKFSKHNLNGDHRFWMTLDGGSADECWPWAGALAANGYGRVRRGHKSMAAHRVAYELYWEPVPEGLCVCHACDNPPCCNPHHLWVGTIEDNTQDMIRKGRNRNGRGK